MAAVALAAAAVSVTGGISFIGLMAPHIAKSLVGPRHQIFMPIALLIGGWLLLLADTIGRNIVEPNGIPAGIVVALIGAPYFMYLLLKRYRKTLKIFLEGLFISSILLTFIHINTFYKTISDTEIDSVALLAVYKGITIYPFFYCIWLT